MTHQWKNWDRESQVLLPQSFLDEGPLSSASLCPRIFPHSKAQSEAWFAGQVDGLGLLWQPIEGQIGIK